MTSLPRRTGHRRCKGHRRRHRRASGERRLARDRRRSRSRRHRARPAAATWCATSATKPSVSALVHSIATTEQRLDALICNAGFMIRKPIADLSLAEWSSVLTTNLTSTFLLVRAAEKLLRAAKGAVVTIASTRARMSEPNTESYSASKGGLVALTHALAISLGPDIRVNCISPGWILTKGPEPSRTGTRLPSRRTGRPGRGHRRPGRLPGRAGKRLHHRRRVRRGRRRDPEDDLSGIEAASATADAARFIGGQFRCVMVKVAARSARANQA